MTEAGVGASSPDRGWFDGSADPTPGGPLGVALGITLRLVVSSAVGRLREAANVNGLSPVGASDREVSLILGEPVHDWPESPWDRESDRETE
jgi:hypothetical protein